MAYNPNFLWKRKTVTITAGTALTAGHQVKLTIPQETEMQADFRDLRFETTNGYGLPHWLEGIVTTTATVWVKLKAAVDASGTVDIYMYYGNPYVASVSNGTNTFVHFDDFEGAGLLTWTNAAGTWVNDGGYRKQTNTASTNYNLKNSYINTSETDYIVHAKFKAVGSVGVHTRQGVATEKGGGTDGVWLYGTIDYTNNAKSVVLDTSSGWFGSTAMGFTVVADTWYVIDMLRQPNVQKVSIQQLGNPLSWQVQTTITSKLYTVAGLGGGYDTVVWYDDFFVRKYVATEPGTPTIGGTASTVNWNPQRQKITINTTTATPVNYQVKITVPHVTYMATDFSDLRFVSKTGTILDYWIESSTPGVTANVWVELADAIDASGSDYIYMHYGNANLTSVSNGNNTFIQWHGAAIVAYLDSLIVPANDIIYETKQKMTSATWNIYAGIADTANMNLGDNLNNQVLWNGAVNNKYAVARNNGTSTIVTVASTLVINQWHTRKIKRFASEAHFYLNDVETGTGITTNLPDATMGLCVHTETGTYAQEYSFARKCVATEPTVDQTAVPEAMNIYTRRKKLTINNNSGGALVDYQVPVTVTYASAMQADFEDLRFVDIDNNLLPHWIETDCRAASGGTITESGGYRIHTFRSSGTFVANKAMNVETLVVAGGGGGGNRNYLNAVGGGGGGAGGLVYQASRPISQGNYTVTIGAGGAGSLTGAGSAGNNSVFDIMTALGGGGGGAYASNGNAGGSGGGAGRDGTLTGGAKTQGDSGGGTGYGFAGGNASGTGVGVHAAGGGGAGAAGYNGGTGAAPVADGGIGKAFTISGSSVYYAGGGGGSREELVTRSVGGLGGGGGGAYNGVIGIAGTANTGGGGGGGGGNDDTSGAGGSGIVIIRYLMTEDLASGLIWIKANLPNYGTTPTGDNTVYMYYGNPSATSASNGTNTFDFFDDFNGTVFNTAKWVEVDTASNYVTQNNQLLFGTGGGWGVAGTYTVSNFTRPFIFETYILSTQVNNDFMFAIKNSGMNLSYTDYHHGVHLYNSQNIEMYENGGSSGLKSTYTINVGFWIRVKVLSTGAEYYQSSDRTTWNLIHSTSAISTDPVKLGFSPNSIGSTQVDNTIVRKYAAIVPTITYGTEEHSRRGGIIIY